MEATVFNPVQQHLLTMFAFDGSEERLNELWDSGVLDQKKLDELRIKHLRTDLK